MGCQTQLLLGLDVFPPADLRLLNLTARKIFIASDSYKYNNKIWLGNYISKLKTNLCKEIFNVSPCFTIYLRQQMIVVVLLVFTHSVAVGTIG